MFSYVFICCSIYNDSISLNGKDIENLTVPRNACQDLQCSVDFTSDRIQCLTAAQNNSNMT